MDFKNLKKNIREPSLKTFAKSLWFPKRKSYPRVWIKKSKENLQSCQANGLLFFVTSISAYRKYKYPPATLGYGVPVMTNIYRSEGLQVRQWKRTPRGFSLNFTVLQEKLYSPFCRTKVSVYEGSQHFFIKILRDKKGWMGRMREIFWNVSST